MFKLINSLTSDEDQRQELWVHYLSGNSANTFVHFLQQIKIKDDAERELQKTIWKIIADESHSSLLNTITHFSEFERELIVLLMIGISANTISGYKGITEIRIKQAIANIKNSGKWKEIWP